VNWDVVLTGVVAAAACALPGTFLVLRGMSLIGDAISHAVLPGIVFAAMITHSLAPIPILIGAGALGLVTVFLIESLYRTRRVKQDTSIAVVFPALFALGVLLIAQFVTHVDLDQECVLYGEIAFAGIRTTDVFAFVVPRPLLTVAIAALANLVFVLLLYKELKLVTFDSALAATLGISPVLVHYLLMGTVSLTTVAAFEAIGAILVVAFLIVPAATAHLLTDRLGAMLALAVAIGVVSSVGGYWLARALGEASVAGCMAATMGAVFALVWLCAPREGILGRLLRLRHNRERFAQALVLARLDRAVASPAQVAEDLRWPRARVDDVLRVLADNGLVAIEGGAIQPTRAGRAFVRSTVD